MKFSTLMMVATVGASTAPAAAPLECKSLSALKMKDLIKAYPTPKKAKA